MLTVSSSLNGRGQLALTKPVSSIPRSRDVHRVPPRVPSDVVSGHTETCQRPQKPRRGDASRDAGHSSCQPAATCSVGSVTPGGSRVGGAAGISCAGGRAGPGAARPKRGKLCRLPASPDGRAARGIQITGAAFRLAPRSSWSRSSATLAVGPSAVSFRMLERGHVPVCQCLASGGGLPQ